jgi:hypothetical protein
MNYPSFLPTAGVLFGLTLQTFKNVSVIFKKKSHRNRDSGGKMLKEYRELYSAFYIITL